MKLIFTLVGFCLLASAATADEALSTAAKKIFEEKQDCVLWVSAVAKTTFSAEGSSDSAMNFPDQENKMEALGTVIDSAGLVVASFRLCTN